MKPIREAVRAFLFHEDKFLLVQQHSGVWVPPGGGIEGGEKPLQALRRELKEELSLSDDDYRVHARSSHEHAYAVPVDEQKDHRGQRELLFVGEILNPDVIVANDEEIVGWKWGSIADLGFLDLREVAEKVVAEFREQ